MGTLPHTASSQLRKGFSTAENAIAKRDAGASVSLGRVPGRPAGNVPFGFAGSFVTREGPRLMLAGRPFRFGGANVEWLGLVGYGPADPQGPRYPSHFEVDDALATAHEMGAVVVRAQTLGDSVGCDVCLEPSLGTFNQTAFEHVDYAIASARRHGLKVIATIVGDDARGGGGGCVYLAWRGVPTQGCSLSYMPTFWTSRDVIHDVEQHIAALLSHRNVYTHVAYKDDPTILGWDLVNGGASPPGWTRTIAKFVRGIDRRHLILSGADNASVAGVDACVAFVYPHWALPLARARRGIARCAGARKPFIAYEYGWDRTNYPTPKDLERFLAALRANPEIVGDAFWALQAHADDHGWMPIPADSSDPATALTGETGEWWALYYTGVPTLVTSAADMAARAQILRRHDYARRALAPPAHAIPPAPVITSIAQTPGGVRIYWRGAAGAKDYSVERRAAGSAQWLVACRRCATDAGDGYLDTQAAAAGASYRVIPYNLDGKAGTASAPAQVSP
jgi:mannan endo-1,4-beta-mannosidase